MVTYLMAFVHQGRRDMMQRENVTATVKRVEDQELVSLYEG